MPIRRRFELAEPGTARSWRNARRLHAAGGYRLSHSAGTLPAAAAGTGRCGAAVLLGGGMKGKLTRREFAAASAGAIALAGCSRQAPVTPSHVSITRALRYDQS